MEMREWVRHGRKGQPSGRQKKSQGSAETRNTMTYESGYAYGHPVRHAMQAQQKAYKWWSEKVSNWIPISIYFDML
jgi:hypothetical protein